MLSQSRILSNSLAQREAIYSHLLPSCLFFGNALNRRELACTCCSNVHTSLPGAGTPTISTLEMSKLKVTKDTFSQRLKSKGWRLRPLLLVTFLMDISNTLCILSCFSVLYKAVREVDIEPRLYAIGKRQPWSSWECSIVQKYIFCYWETVMTYTWSKGDFITTEEIIP